jgi:hypothetical protein
MESKLYSDSQCGIKNSKAISPSGINSPPAHQVHNHLRKTQGISRDGAGKETHRHNLSKDIIFCKWLADKLSTLSLVASKEQTQNFF